MVIKIAIVEDDEDSANKIKDYIEQFGKDSEDLFSITRFSDGDEIASDYKPLFNIIFLDIQMKRLDGMSTAEIIRKMDKDVILVFITNMAQYAIKGYAVDALDFLLKPIPYFAFSQQLMRSVERLKKRQSSYLLLPTENGVVKMEATQIIFIESFKHKMTVHTRNESYTMPSTMKELEEKLEGHNFFRCNSGYLVNLAYVKGINGNCVKIWNSELVISRPRKKAFMEALAGYVGGLTK